MNQSYLNIDGINNLRIAIVTQAVKDYKTAYAKIRKDPNDYIATEQIKSLEKFFRSEYCYLLSGCDGEALIHGLRERLGNEYKRKSDKRDKQK